MKQSAKVFLVMAAALLLWGAVVVTGTLRGWWHRPIAEGDSPGVFLEAVERVTSAEFVGSVALALMEGGEVQREHFYSVDVEVDRNTVFQVASMSKWISAVGVMTLVEDGRIDLDAYWANAMPPVSMAEHEAIAAAIENATIVCMAGCYDAPQQFAGRPGATGAAGTMVATVQDGRTVKAKQSGDWMVRINRERDPEPGAASEAAPAAPAAAVPAAAPEAGAEQTAE